MIPQKRIKIQHEYTQINKQDILCEKGNLSTQCCINSQCQHYAFICNNRTCQCHAKHIKQNRRCVPTQTQYMYENLLSKIVSIQQLKQKIHSRIEKAIERILKQEEIFVNSLERRLKYAGLTQNQKIFIRAKQYGKYNGINGKLLSEIVQTSSESINISIKKSLEKALQKINDIESDIVNGLQKSFRKIKRLFQIFTQIPQQQKQKQSQQSLQIIQSPSQQQKSKSLTQTVNDKQNHNKITKYMLEHFNNDRKKLNACYLINSQLKKYGWPGIQYWKKQDKVVLAKQMYTLALRDKKINMQEFIDTAHYSHIQQIHFGEDCQIDDEGWRTLVQNAYKFGNLKVLYLNDNLIMNVNQSELNCFKALECISLQRNPLNQKSIQALRNYKKNHSNIIICITIDGFPQLWQKIQ